MQSVSSRIWTPVAVSISYDDNHYTTGTSGSNEYEVPFGKVWIPFSPKYALNSTTTVLLQGCSLNQITHEVWYAINKET